MSKPFLVICVLSSILAISGFVFLFAAPEPLFIYGAFGLLAGTVLFLSFFVFVTVRKWGWKVWIMGFLIYFSVGALLGGLTFLEPLISGKQSEVSFQTVVPRVVIGGLLGWLILPSFMPEEWRLRPRKQPKKISSSNNPTGEGSPEKA